MQLRRRSVQLAPLDRPLLASTSVNDDLPPLRILNQHRERLHHLESRYRAHLGCCFAGKERLMGFEPTTFCMASLPPRALVQGISGLVKPFSH
jgi:hypothetical protein